MKRLIAVLLTLVMVAACFTGCAKKGTIKKRNRQLYSKVALKDYVEINNYKGIVVDTKSSQFSSYFDAVVADDVWEKKLYQVLDKEGEVKDGDIVNLDYEGKLDGVAFAGGTAKGYDLEIGSGTFIDDFEEELIGAKVGDTRDVTAVFPTPYPNNSELAGKEAVFTCKINYIVRFDPFEETYKKLGFESLQAYKDDITKRAAKNYIHDTVIKNKKIKNYPEKDKELMTNTIVSYVTSLYAKENVSLETALAQNGMTLDQFKQQATTEMMNDSMVMYYILDTEELDLLESTVNSQDAGVPAVLAESYAVQDIVLNFLYDNAVIK